MAETELSAGKRIGRFVLAKHLGTGGMGSVWSARQDDGPDLVALKFLHPHLAENRESRERLRREAKAFALVAHPGIVPVREVLETEGFLFLVMEQLQGQTFKSLLDREKQLSFRAACSVLAEVADVLRAAHAAGVVHRDLKPENIFLLAGGGAGRVRVLDFGVAKVFENPIAGKTPLTALDTVLGTIAYMAPEQWTQASTVDGRADVWALGTVLYEALVGFLPIEGASSNEIIRRLLTDAVTPIGALVTDVPEELGHLANRMLSRSPERRPGIEEIHAVLGRFALC